VIDPSILYNECVSDCCLRQMNICFSHIMARTSYISMGWWWWCHLCTRPTRL